MCTESITCAPVHVHVHVINMYNIHVQYHVYTTTCCTCNNTHVHSLVLTHTRTHTHTQTHMQSLPHYNVTQPVSVPRLHPASEGPSEGQPAAWGWSTAAGHR